MNSLNEPAPVTAEAFAALCAAFRAPDRISIAVSGGRDSMALACLAARWAKAKGAQATAFIVDHGLRPESAQEAEQAARWCEALGLNARILVWMGDKPSSGMQEAARETRYAMIARAANEAGIGAVVTGHSADDQIETFLMRLARGSGAAGLSSMADEVLIVDGAHEPVRLLRPLMEFSRAQITATVQSFGQPYIDDPSNDDLSYERVAIRKQIQELETSKTLSREAILRSIKRLQAATARMRQQETEEFNRLSGCIYRWGGVCVDIAPLLEARSETSSALAARLIYAVSGEKYRPENDSAGAALETALKDGAATLAGALVKKKQQHLWFVREPAAILGRSGVNPLPETPLPTQCSVLWDRRFIIRNDTEMSDLTVAPLGSACEVQGFQGPKEGLTSAPGFFRSGTLIAAPKILSGAPDGLSVNSLNLERFNGGIIRFA